MSDKTIFRCDGCGRMGDGEDPDLFREAKDLLERMEPGDMFTNVECTDCGALAYPDKDAVWFDLPLGKFAIVYPLGGGFFMDLYFSKFLRPFSVMVDTFEGRTQLVCTDAENDSDDPQAIVRLTNDLQRVREVWVGKLQKDNSI